MKNPIKFQLTIGTKLISLIAGLLVSSVVTVVWLSTHLFIQDNTALIQQMNADTASSLATQTKALFQSITEKMRIVGAVILRAGEHPETKDSITPEFFSKDEDFLGVFVYAYDASGQPTLKTSALSPEMSRLGDPQGERAQKTILEKNEFHLAAMNRGEVQLGVVKLTPDYPVMAIGIPFIKTERPDYFSHSLVALVRESKFTKTFSESDIATCFLVDSTGRMLAHPDVNLVLTGENVAKTEIVARMLEGKFGNGETRYVDPKNKTPKLGAFRVVGFGGLGVVAEVPEAKAFEAAKRVEMRATLVTGIVLCLAFLLGYLYSDTITWPIQKLVDAAVKVSQGDFNVHLRAKSKDEVGKLTETFNQMVDGLVERDRVKETFNKFHNKEIAEKLLSGEVKLGGEKKNATVFFSDIRGFTAISEALRPEEVVELVNEYMTAMVSVIRKHGGVVDKYVGDAIMALWGVPLEGPEDTFRAVKACLEMRERLAQLNELRISRGQQVLRIGMGVNSGEVIAGNIGSNEKMEYTVIGDAVNTASRIESMTKEFGTDLLISASVYEKVKDRFVVQNMGGAKVKGKSTSLEVYCVSGYINDQGEAVTVETPYSSYTAEASDKVVHEPKAA